MFFKADFLFFLLFFVGEPVTKYNNFFSKHFSNFFSNFQYGYDG